MIKKILTLAATEFITMSIAHASGLSISPARLDFALADNSRGQKTVIVLNPSSDVMVFEIYPDEFAKVISANPESFTLESGARKEVEITINTKNINESQSISTNISVVGKALAESKVNMATGAKIPITISINPAIKRPNLIIQYGIMILAALAIILLLTRQRLVKK